MLVKRAFNHTNNTHRRVASTLTHLGHTNTWFLWVAPPTNGCSCTIAKAIRYWRGYFASRNMTLPITLSHLRIRRWTQLLTDSMDVVICGYTRKRLTSYV